MICFAHVIGSIVAMSTALFLVYMIQFVPGYPILLAVFCQLLEFCLLGTVLTVKVYTYIVLFFRSAGSKLLTFRTKKSLGRSTVPSGICCGNPNVAASRWCCTRVRTLSRWPSEGLPRWIWRRLWRFVYNVSLSKRPNHVFFFCFTDHESNLLLFHDAHQFHRISQYCWSAESISDILIECRKKKNLYRF